MQPSRSPVEIAEASGVVVAFTALSAAERLPLNKLNALTPLKEDTKIAMNIAEIDVGIVSLLTKGTNYAGKGVAIPFTAYTEKHLLQLAICICSYLYLVQNQEARSKQAGGHAYCCK